MSHSFDPESLDAPVGVTADLSSLADPVAKAAEFLARQAGRDPALVRKLRKAKLFQSAVVLGCLFTSCAGCGGRLVDWFRPRSPPPAEPPGAWRPPPPRVITIDRHAED